MWNKSTADQFLTGVGTLCTTLNIKYLCGMKE